MSEPSRHSSDEYGGMAAHIFRRLVHLGSILILWLYYHYGATAVWVWAGLGVVLALETLRLSCGWTVFGQRHYEQKQISAFAWGIIGMACVLLFAPGKALAIPIICAYAVGDPVLGELRRAGLPQIFVFILGVAVITTIWWLCYRWFNTPLWLALPMGFITAAAEWPCFTWIDDNALMQLIPLAIVIITR